MRDTITFAAFNYRPSIKRGIDSCDMNLGGGIFLNLQHLIN